MAQRLDPRELRLRIMSAIALGAIAIACLWFHPLSFAGLVAALGVLMAWEWGRAVRGTEFDLSFWIHAIVVVGAVAAPFLLQSSILSWLALAVGAAVVSFVAQPGTRTMSAIGVAYIGIPAVLVGWLRQDEEFGVTAILFVLVVVAAHDTFAMLTGKLVGGPRLWPLLSPNKTWSGVAGGLLASLLAGYLYGAGLAPPKSIAWFALLGLVLGVAGFAGDLAESAFKRRYQIRHASGLIPGHGGILDRLDGLVGAIVVAALIGVVLNAQAPARALLFYE